MKVLVACVALLAAIVVFGLLQGYFMTWGSFTEEELKEMGVRRGRKER